MSDEKNSGIEKVRSLFGWTAPPGPEFLRFKALAGLLPPSRPDSANALMLADLLKKNPDQVSWDEIRAGELALVAVMPTEMLQARFGSLMDEFETVTGRKPFAQDVFPYPPTTPAEWHAGVVSLMEDLAKFRRIKLMFERARSVVGMCFGCSLLAFGLSGFFYAAFNQDKTSDPTAGWQPLLFCGIAGAGFSVLSRLYGLRWSPRVTVQIEDMQALKKGLVINCFLSVAEGAVAAGGIYLLFTSGLLKGDLFPEFDMSGNSDPSIFKQFFATHPKSTTDVAKLLAWAFIAGFTERLVPDKLNRLAGETSDKT
jgi:hypothetical protein